MKKAIFILSLFFGFHSYGQIPKSFDGRWCFTGSRILQFREQKGILYCKFIKEHETKQFLQFYQNKQTSDSMSSIVTIDSSKSKIFLTTTLKSDREFKSFFFVYDKSNDSTLYFVGDVYYDTTRIKYTNLNCNSIVPTCSNYFYTKRTLTTISKLKDISSLTREEAFEVFKRFKAVSTTRCNRCYEGFPGADFNNILINMGFNPISQEKFNNEIVYETSAFDYIMDKFVGRESQKKDKELYDYYKLISNEFFNGKIEK
jgi:hypothetical protein